MSVPLQKRFIVGKKVVKIDTERCLGTEANGNATNIRSITFDDGSQLVFSVHELGHDYAVVPNYYPNRTRKASRD